MATLDFAFWDAIPHSSSGAAIADDYDAHIALAQRIEALGWHSYFVIEHQNAPQGVSAPSVYLAAVARETSRLRFGAMMWQLPFYNPLRLAQDVAMLDQLSHAGEWNSELALASMSTSSSAGAWTITSAPPCRRKCCKSSKGHGPSRR